MVCLGLHGGSETPVKILEGSDVYPKAQHSSSSETKRPQAQSEGVYVIDSPGVFPPYVPDGESMLKLALCGCVKEGLVPPLTLADYLLYRFEQGRSYMLSTFGWLEDGKIGT